MQCLSCGYMEEAGARFCRKCGAAMAGEQTPQQQPPEQQQQQQPPAQQPPPLTEQQQPPPPGSKKAFLPIMIIAAVVVFALGLSLVLWISGVFGSHDASLNNNNTNTENGQGGIQNEQNGNQNGTQNGNQNNNTGNNTFTDFGGEEISITELVNNLREEFADTQNVIFQPSLINVPRDHVFYIDLEFEFPLSLGYESYSDVMTIYMDAELTLPIWVRERIEHKWSNPEIPEGHSRLYLSPDYNATGRVRNSYVNPELPIGYEVIYLDNDSEYYLYQGENYTNWGYLKYFYLALHADPITGERLSKPIVTIFTIENQLEAPESEFFITDEGNGGFRWNKVEGAEYYLIVRMRDEVRREGSIAPADYILNPIAKTTGTSWTHPEIYEGFLMNWAFRYDDYFNENFSVIAVGSDTHSPVGTIHNGREIGARLARAWDWETDKLTSGNWDERMTFFVRDLSLLPTHRPLEMQNSESVYRKIIYDFDNTEIIDITFRFWDEGFGDERPNEWVLELSLHIPFVLEGSQFSGYIAAGINLETYEAELLEIRKQLEETAPRGGGSTTIDVTNRKDIELPPDINIPDLNVPDLNTPPDGQPDDLGTIFIRQDETVFANSALTAYLARNLLVANEIIDLSLFPESTEWEYLLSAFREALYQNPLIMHIDGAGMIPGTNLFIVLYRENAEKINEQQQALRSIVPQIIGEIILPGMTGLEKSFAINNYLIENSKYDFDALLDAEKNNFQSVDERFNDSFTAYGILINKVGVCAGYADAFKLLSDAAGLESIVVTGFLEGFLPHAWNRVYIDGHWHTIDVTNNANELLLNAFLNLPDNAARRLLVEDNQYMMKQYITGYRSTDNSSEYYNVSGKFYEINDIASALAKLINRDGSATLRTDYDLDDETFALIVREVRNTLGIKNLFGSHILGVIWMSTTPG